MMGNNISIICPLSRLFSCFRSSTKDGQNTFYLTPTPTTISRGQTKFLPQGHLNEKMVHCLHIFSFSILSYVRISKEWSQPMHIIFEEHPPPKKDNKTNNQSTKGKNLNSCHNPRLLKIPQTKQQQTDFLSHGAKAFMIS